VEPIAGLYALPLQAAHYRLGPLPLRDALQVLAGQTWKIQVDERSREVCFELRPEFQPGVA
jgi:type IV pili sensor histidine kinase/response regulator